MHKTNEQLKPSNSHWSEILANMTAVQISSTSARQLIWLYSFEGQKANYIYYYS